MPSLLRLCFTAGVLSLALLVAGCEDFDPTAIFDSDMFNTKKKLSGERRPVFPEGTPGVPQGVPPELIKGYHQPAQAAQAGQVEPKESAKQASAAPDESKPKPKKVVAKPAETPASAPVQSPQEASAQPQPPAPAPRQAPGASAAWPASPQPSGGVAWPDPPPTR